MENEKTSKRRVLQGKVVSNKMDKTVVVEVERRVLHPKYKSMKKEYAYHAHDENNECEFNDVVQIKNLDLCQSSSVGTLLNDCPKESLL